MGSIPGQGTRIPQLHGVTKKKDCKGLDRRHNPEGHRDKQANGSYCILDAGDKMDKGVTEVQRKLNSCSAMWSQLRSGSNSHTGMQKGLGIRGIRRR